MVTQSAPAKAETTHTSKREPRDVHAIRTLLRRPHPVMSVLTRHTFGAFGVLHKLFEQIGPTPSSDLQSTTTESGLADSKAEALLYNLDDGHAGRYTIPPAADRGASLSFDYVAAQPDAPSYVSDNLRFYPEPKEAATPAHAPLVYFSPGLNTLHQPAPGETTTPHRLAHYCRVLLSVPMAQIHIGTQLDQGDVVIDASSAPFLRLFIRTLGGLLPDAVRPVLDGKNLVFDKNNVDGMQAGLSIVNVIDTPLKKRFRELLDTTRDPNTQPFTLAVYSRATMELNAALHQHYDDSRDNRNESNQDVFNRLRAKLTVLTVGVACRFFVDGPAYVHLSAWADPLASSAGVNGKDTHGAGRDAVFVNCETPYNEESFDNHNFGSITAQWLSIVLARNGVTDVRALWEKAQQNGGKVIGVDGDKDQEIAVIAAMIVLTGGLDWLWTPEEALKDVPADFFPDRQTAKQTIKDAVGEAFLLKILAAFPETSK